MLNLENRANAVHAVIHVHDQFALLIGSSRGGIMVPRSENEAPAGCVVDHGGVKAECRQKLVVGSAKQIQT